MGQIQESVIDLFFEIEETVNIVSDKFIISEDGYLELMMRKYPKKINKIPKIIHFEESLRSTNYFPI